MIRRAFLRRMAHAAMAGMLGLELVSRAPKVVADPSVVRKYTSQAIENLTPGSYVSVVRNWDEVQGVLTVTEINHLTGTITVQDNVDAKMSDYVIRAYP